MYFLIVVMIAVAVQAVLSYDEQKDLQRDMKQGEFIIEEDI